jgi:hypothetical protein
MISKAFEFLDPKDALYSNLVKVGASKYMPPTTLIPWDCKDEIEIGLLPSTPSLLKASIGIRI